MSGYQTGYIHDPVAIRDTVQRMESQGNAVSFSAEKPGLKGQWEFLKGRGVTGVFLQDAEESQFGETQPAFSQQIGSCVSMGTARAIQDTYYWALYRLGEMGAPVQIATEPIYAGSRVQIGKGQLGRGDGSMGAWAAEWVRFNGLVARGVYGNIDLSVLHDEFAKAWGMPNAGCPDSLQAISKTHLVGACHQLANVDEMADAVASGHAVAYCCQRIRGKPNADGYAASSSDGGHCTEICAVLLSVSGRLAFVEQQSWEDYPGPVTLKFQGGEKKLRQGSFGVYADDLQRCLDQGGDAWCFDKITSFRGVP